MHVPTQLLVPWTQATAWAAMYWTATAFSTPSSKQLHVLSCGLSCPAGAPNPVVSVWVLDKRALEGGRTTAKEAEQVPWELGTAPRLQPQPVWKLSC